MTKITACSTLASSLSPLEVALEHITGYGFDRVEISDQLTHSKHFSPDTVNPVQVRNLFDKYSLGPVAANCTLATFFSSQPGVRSCTASLSSRTSR